MRQDNLEGQGLLETKAPANPAAGANFSYSVPTNQRLRLISFCFTFTADANAANRTLEIRLMDDEGTPVQVFLVDHATAITASQADVVSMAEGLPRDHTGGKILMPCPSNFILKQGYALTVTVVNIQVGDQISNPRLYVERWIEE